MNVQACRRAGVQLAALLVFAALPLAAQDVGLPIGATPAAAVVQDLDGQPVDLSTLTGRKPVVFEFWASWCEVCEALMPKMLQAQQRFGTRVDFVLVGVGVNQSRTSMRRHRDQHHLPFAYYFDNNGAAVRAFMAPATSFVAIVDGRGKVVYTGSGEEQNVEAALTRVLSGGR